MSFSLLKHYLESYITETALKVSRSLYCFTTSVSHGVENCFHRLWGTGISNAIFVFVMFDINIKDNITVITRQWIGIWICLNLILEQEQKMDGQKERQYFPTLRYSTKIKSKKIRWETFPQ